VTNSGAARAFAVVALAFGIAAASSADAPALAGSAAYAARVVHVRDGDSLIVSDGERQRDLRIGEIDAPERDQPWGPEAERALAQLVADRALRVEFLELDRYGREVSKLWVDGACVACALVRDGHAFAFRKYLRDPRLLDLEREAREARRGLWRADAPVPPSAWRRGIREFPPERLRAYLGKERSRGDPDVFECTAKTRCEQMSSCAEARFHLEQCGAAQLDRDGDGVPCDSRCR
jgi:endonuclease YncB( thermonuclease family)